MKVLQVTPDVSPMLGGTTTAALNLCRALVRAGVGTTLVSTDLDEVGTWRPAYAPKTLAATSVPNEGFDIHCFATSWPSRLGVSRGLARFLREHAGEFDLIHIHRLYRFSTQSAIWHARKSGVPYFISPHGVLLPYHRRRRRLRKLAYDTAVQNTGLRHAAAIHYATTYEKRLAPPWLDTVPSIVIPNGINPDEFAHLPAAGSFRSLHPELRGQRLVVFLGRIAPQKGLDLLIEAFSSIASSLKDVHLVIAGPDYQGHRTLVQAWVEKANIKGRTTLLGALFGSDRMALLSDSDVCVLPSYAENFGIAAVEALACRVPLVISDRVGIWEEVRSAAAGLVVPCRADALYRAMRRILTNPALGARVAENGFNLATKRFTWDVAARDMARAYESIVRDPIGSVSW